MNEIKTDTSMMGKLTAIIVCIIMVVVVFVPIASEFSTSETTITNGNGVGVTLDYTTEMSEVDTLNVSINDETLTIVGDNTDITGTTANQIVIFSDTYCLTVTDGKLALSYNTNGKTEYKSNLDSIRMMVSTNGANIDGTVYQFEQASYVYYPNADGNYNSYDPNGEYEIVEDDNPTVGTWNGYTIFSNGDVIGNSIDGVDVVADTDGANTEYVNPNKVVQDVTEDGVDETTEESTEGNIQTESFKVNTPVYGVSANTGTTFTVDNITYFVTKPNTVRVNKVLSTYEGTTITVPGTVEYDGETYTVTQFGNGNAISNSNIATMHTIENYTIVTKIVLPETITTLGTSCFYDCTSLASIDLSNVTSLSDSCFYDCTSLASIDLSNVTSLGNSCFYGCTSLTSIGISNVTSLGNSCFYGCTSLTSIGTLNVTSLGNSCFYGCTSLTSIDLSNVTSLGNNCFYGCRALVDIGTINVTEINAGTFYDCRKLASIDLSNVAKITNTSTSTSSSDRGAFADCFSLTSVILPSNLTEIGYRSFGNCGNLTTVIIAGNPNIYTSDTDDLNPFYGCTKLTNILNLSELDIEAGSTSNGMIGYYAENIDTGVKADAVILPTEKTVSSGDGASVYTIIGIMPIIVVIGLIGMIVGSFVVNRYKE